MVGVATALALQERGRDVLLIDRREPGRETSFGNAGVIQAEAVEPYAFPRGLGALWRMALGRSEGVSYRLRDAAAQAGPLLRYHAASAPARHRRTAATYAGLVRRATADHAPLIAASGADNLIRRDGFLQIHREAGSFEAAHAQARRAAEVHGVRSRVLTGEEARRAEPALRETPAGAIRWEESWTCADPGALVEAYAALFRRRGGSVARGDAEGLREAGGGWTVATADGPASAAEAVVALGPWSGPFLRRRGCRPALVLKRGYHRHYRAPARIGSTLVLADDGVVVAPMRAGARLTTGAEIAGLDAPASPGPLRRAERAAGRLLGLGDPAEAEPWMGVRPCMADMLPVLGPAPRHRGLWLHFGHGHQGFTLGPTTAAMLADAMQGTAGAIPGPLAPDGRL
jgi:D-amino-acid dehydrogenase